MCGTVPEVKLDMDTISDVIASNLAFRLFGHVLFLKGQILFPIGQLGRLPSGKAPKIRNEFVNAVDTLQSHLDTTFTALSTAFARSAAALSCPESFSADDATKRRAYMAILIGPSIHSAKAKVFLGIDGLRARIWGQRDEAAADFSGDDSDEQENGSGDDDDDISELDSDGDEGTEAPPDDDEGQESSDDENTEDDGEDDYSESEDELPAVEEQQQVRTADRLLSRIMASAEAEGEGLTGELPLTQTHIVIRAPRRFVHPAWTPQQNASIALEGMLQTFLDESNLLCSTEATAIRSNGMAKRRRPKVEGVWLSCRNGIRINYKEPTEDVSEEDEMIWWHWSGGKIVGFSDW
ncbi:hypothetical protein FISHEDRAFT_65797 [Fistulina hepatica ATCC 64428]|uniref:Uncharacterized protein n=1 Tax=Fistulina hepatica ATCC 64428 TaxID=1128425 RepID=A0A0D7ACV9_9AGAR|nr:hypothetical protein FISHEDRAFT_65797 [Fistulina hepatica ATCC 64428]